MSNPTPRSAPQGRLAGKVSLITGAAQGIGEATAFKFAAEGAIVIVCDINPTGIEAVVQQCRALGAEAEGHVMDVTDRATIDAVVAKVQERHGRIDVLVNNAGITQDARLVKMTEEQFDRVIDINLRGVFHCSQAVAPGMIERNSGVILNATAKFGLIGFTKTWSRELGPKGVRVNAVAPGFIATPILNAMPEKVLDGMKARIPLGRLGKPAEIANVYAFLASDEASYINGEVIEVSGGISL